MDCPLTILQKRLQTIRKADYPCHSRVHPLKSFQFPATQCFIKREDELGFGISGSKIRKYSSLIPHLIEKAFPEAVIIGSSSSNHVLGICQLLIENNIKPKLFLRGDPSYSLQGNCLLSSLFVPPSCIQWISKKEWNNVEARAQEYASKQPHPIFVLPEGGSVAAALPGALTLPLDVLENQKKHAAAFDHIFIEAGTGFMASALILGLNLLKVKPIVHVLLLADDKQAFLTRLKNCHRMFVDLMKAPIPPPQNFMLHQPIFTRSFGETNPAVFKFIKQIALEEGFLTDPIYSAKLLMEGKEILSQSNIEGNVLMIHSGGALTLMGFHDQIKLEVMK